MQGFYIKGVRKQLIISKVDYHVELVVIYCMDIYKGEA